MSHKIQKFPEVENVGKDTIPRFFVDIRVGCAAVRDREHPYYSIGYSGLFRDTADVVEYRQGFKNPDTGRWEIKEEDIRFLTEYCASLNKEK